MKIGIAQLNSTDDVAANLKVIKDLIKSASSEKPDLILFPENSLYFRIHTVDKIQALSLEDETFKELQGLSDQYQVALQLTTAIGENGHVYNATVMIEPKKQLRIVYRKIHLFDIELQGQKPIRESDVFANGPESSITNFKNCKIGQSICYDVRFAELYSVYARAEVDLLVIPAAFLVKTGRAHWEVLLRARAIESQCYVAAPAQVGEHFSKDKSGAKRETYGHSMLVSPWGEIKVSQVDGIGMLFADINHEEISSVRRQIPMKNHRRIE